MVDHIITRKHKRNINNGFFKKKVADAYKRKGIATRMLAHFEETELREAEFRGSSDGGAVP